jgi:mono/diheme cytochrome c family protein
MTLYMLFAGLGVLVYFGAAFAAAASGNRVYVDLGFHVALFASVAIALVATVLFYASRFARAFAFVVLLVCIGAVTIVIAATREVGEPLAAPAPTQSPVSAVAAESAGARAAGEKLFQELGCIGCHLADGSGIGPSLVGVFGRPVADAGCGALTVDAEYIREAILNPTATVAAGFQPVMPTFAGRVTEEQLRALIAYVKSRVPVKVQRKLDGESR